MKYTGAMFEKAIRGSDINISLLAKKLNVNRRTIYNWFAKDTVSIDVIHRASEVIGEDFFKYFPDLQKGRIQAAADADYWKSKYMLLLEQYNILLNRLKHAS